MNPEPATLNRPFAKLRQFVQQRERPVERCEMCSAVLAAEHVHLIEPYSRQIVCSCDACAMLFPNRPELKYRRIPRDVRRLSNFRLSDLQWDSLLIPINMAFFFLSSPAGRVVALYPSPAGATESLLELAAWNEVVSDNPILQTMEADVEALLVNRLGKVNGRAAAEYYLAPIDKCYKLVGLMRTKWRGLSGGTEVWEEIKSFFEALQGEAT